jgi:alpha-glucosidase
MMKKVFCLIVVVGLALHNLYAQKVYTLQSPDARIQVSVSIDKTVTYAVTHDGELLLAPSALSMALADGQTWGVAPKLTKLDKRSVNTAVPAVIYKKQEVPDVYNEYTFKFKGNYQIVFRAYNDGVAYRFVSTADKPFKVVKEQVEYNFPADHKAYIPYVRDEPANDPGEQFFNSFENVYSYISLSEWDRRRYAFTPVLVEAAHGKKIGIVEADLMNYPGMYLHNETGAPALKGVFAPCPKDVEQGGHNRLEGIVKSREDFLAKYDKGTTFPWRALIITAQDKELADNDMVYRLATPTVDMDFSWIKPGKVAWDWWNDWNIYGVDFEAGINNATYKYYIDFAAKYGIEYVILDEGWAVNLQADLFQVVPEIDLKELVDYGNSKGVGLILWAGYYAFDRNMEEVCRVYAGMGIKGFKVDFMDRDDQIMVDFHRRTAETAAKYKLIIDFHGTYKPTGLQRTYPNVVNFEGVNGLEQVKWHNFDYVTYEVTIPFVRMLAGPFDYTQGAMRNASKRNFRPVETEPMSQGTRCRQLAEYVVFESPLNMLCDSPTNYMKEDQCSRFIAGAPTVWDETIALDGEIGKYAAIARRKGNQWYIGALTNWDARTLQFKLDFVSGAKYQIAIFQDGVNAQRVASDYTFKETTVAKNDALTIDMKPGGGWVAVLTPAE